MNEDENNELKFNLKLARNCETPPEVLIELSSNSNSEIRKLVASNPNTPISALKELGKEFPDAITANPIFNLLLLENRDSKFIKLSLARSSTTSPETLSKLADSKSYYDINILIAVAENPSTPISVLKKLSTWFPDTGDNTWFSGIEESIDETYWDGVQQAVASNPKTQSYILNKLARHLSEDVREKVASSPNVSQAILRQLAKDREINVLFAVTNNLKTPLSLTQKILERLVKYGDFQVRQKALNHPHITDRAIAIHDFLFINPIKTKKIEHLKLLPALAKDSRDDIRQKVASYRLTSSKILKELAKDKDERIKKSVAIHKNTDSKTLEELTLWLVNNYINSIYYKPYRSYTDDNKGIFKALIRHTNITPKAIDIILDIRNSDLEEEIAYSQAASPENLDRLTDILLKTDPNNTYPKNTKALSLICSNPNLSVRSIEKFYLSAKVFEDKLRTEEFVDSFFSLIPFGFYDLISHPNFPIVLLDKLATHPLSSIRIEVAKNPRTPDYVLSKILRRSGNIVLDTLDTHYEINPLEYVAANSIVVLINFLTIQSYRFKALGSRL